MGKPAANDVKRRKTGVEEEEGVEGEEDDEVKAEDWAAAAAIDVGDENEDDDDDEDENEKEEEEGKRYEMKLFPEQRGTSAPFPPLGSARDRRDSCGWRHSR